MPSEWVSEKEASQVLSIDEKTLEIFREEGYLKPGSHWRSSSDPEQLPWKPKVFYCTNRCREVIESWEKHEISTCDEIAA